MTLQPSRKDSFGPPKAGRNVTDLGALVRHHGSYLRSLDPGMLDGRWRTPQPVRPGPSPLVGGDEGGDSGESDSVVGEDGDRLTLTHLGTQVWQLSAVPVPETLVVRFHPGAGAGVEWKRAEHYTIDDDSSVVVITAASLAAARAQVNDVFSAQYLRMEAADVGPVIEVPEDGAALTDTTPTISGSSAGGRPIEVFVDGTSVGTTTSATDGAWSLDSTMLTLGEHTAFARQSNPDGATVDSPEIEFAIGATATFLYESDWRYLFTSDTGADYSSPSVDDSGWAVGQAGFYRHTGISVNWPWHVAWPAAAAGNAGWFRRDVADGPPGRILDIRRTGGISVWWDGVLVRFWATGYSYTTLHTTTLNIPEEGGELVIKAEPNIQGGFFDARLQ